MRTVAADPFVKPADLDGTGIGLLPIDDLMSVSDFVMLSYYLDATTHHLINKERWAMMKPTSFIINVARGSVIDEPAPIGALQSGAISGAGLDVFEKEPPALTNPLLKMEQVVVTHYCLPWTDRFVEGSVQAPSDL